MGLETYKMKNLLFVRIQRGNEILSFRSACLQTRYFAFSFQRTEIKTLARYTNLAFFNAISQYVLQAA